MLGVSENQDIIQVNNNMQSLVTAKEKYGFSEWSLSPRGIACPKRQNLPLIRFVLPNIQLKASDA